METSEPLHIQRIRKELRWLNDRSGINARLIRVEGADYVLYEGIETGSKNPELPLKTDVIVPVPAGYPTSQIDMPGLPIDSKLIPYVQGGANPQAEIIVDDRHWKILSYHPYANGGGPPWNPSLHGFHDYYNQLYPWLRRI
jgi:hypothetical protein